MGVPASMGPPTNNKWEIDRTAPLAPYCAANLLIKQHSAGAKARAFQLVQGMREAGDERGECAWMGIFDAELSLEATKPADGEATR